MMRRDPGPFFPIAGCLMLLAVAGPVVALLLDVPPRAALAAFADDGAREALQVSLVASTLATALATILGVPAGYWLGRIAPAPRAAALFVLALPLAFPPVASGIMLLHVVGARSPLGAWSAAHGLPLVASLAGDALAEFFVAGAFVASPGCEHVGLHCTAILEKSNRCPKKFTLSLPGGAGTRSRGSGAPPRGPARR